MGVKRKTYVSRDGDVIDTEEYHDGRYGAPGMKRAEKKKPTKEDMQKVNAWNKTKRARLRLLKYFDEGDLFAHCTYKVDERPEDMAAAVADFGEMMGRVRRAYKKRGHQTVYWIRNIEKGTKGAWHIHIIIKETHDKSALSILQHAWTHGEVKGTSIRQGNYYDEDMTRLASYITKDENTVEYKKDGTPARPRVRETSFNSSRNMPLPKPRVDMLVRWKKELKPKKGYYIARCFEGVNPKTGYKYRHCTMIKLDRRI